MVPEHNSVAERMNHTLVEKACSMMAHTGLPKGYRAEAVNMAVYLTNRTPHGKYGHKPET